MDYKNKKNQNPLVKVVSPINWNLCLLTNKDGLHLLSFEIYEVLREFLWRAGSRYMSTLSPPYVKSDAGYIKDLRLWNTTLGAWDINFWASHFNPKCQGRKNCCLLMIALLLIYCYPAAVDHITVSSVGQKYKSQFIVAFASFIFLVKDPCLWFSNVKEN